MENFLQPYLTKTSDWSLVIQRATTESVEVWFGTLNPHLQKPASARLVLMNENKIEIDTIIIKPDDWLRPFKGLNKRFFSTCVFNNLQPNTTYFVRFDRILPESAGELAGIWQDLCSGELKTLPTSLPLTQTGQFTIAFGSCYYSHRDEGKAALAYKALYENGSPKLKPDIKFLIGDQVYLDIGMDSFSFDANEILERIANIYERNWQFLGDIFRRGATWMIPDDHEFWNDYPFYHSLIPTLWPLLNKNVRQSTIAAATEAIKNIQRSQIVEILEIGNDISICLTDFRTTRNNVELINADGFNKIITWAKGLKTPGVIVTTQNLLDTPGGSEKNLLDYPNQYQQLISALAYSGNDIVSLSGDIHFGRVGIADLGDKGAKLIEIVSSPLSNLTGLGGIANSVANDKPTSLPTGVKLSNPTFDPQYFVKKAKTDVMSGYPKQRTKEHFMTAAFSKNTAGNIELIVNAWLVRSIKGGLPEQSFKQPFKIILNANRRKN